MKMVDEDYEGPYRESKSPFKRFGWDCEADRRHNRIDYKLIQNWLQSKVGEAWDEVYSAFCKKFKREEERSYVSYFVELNVIKVDKEYLNSKGEGFYQRLFVYDGVLRRSKRDRSKYKAKTVEERRWEKGIYHDDKTIYGFINGIWYELELRSLSNQLYKPLDVFFNTSYISDANKKLCYGNSHLYAASRRQLNGKELAQLGLKNNA